MSNRATPRPASDQVRARDDTGRPLPYYRRALSEREGYRRLEEKLAQLEIKQSSLSKLCDVCGRRTRAWRIVPVPPDASKFQVKGLRGRFLLCCDQPVTGCATALVNSGIAKEAVQLYERIERMGLVLP